MDLALDMNRSMQSEDVVFRLTDTFTARRLKALLRTWCVGLKPFGISVFLSQITACGPGGEGLIYHPTRANEHEDAIEWILDDPSTHVPGSSLSLTALDTIGALEAPLPEVFGNVAGLVTDSLNRIYILDSQFNEVRIFAPNGGHLLTVGRPGQGPGEFLFPGHIGILADQSILVVDRGGRLKVFDPPDSVGMVENLSIPVPFEPEAVCTMNGHLFLRGWSPDGGMIHKYEFDGTRVLSFGEPYLAELSLTSSRLSRGTIACDPSTDTVIDVMRFFPVVRGYSGVGELKWVATIPGFAQMEIGENPSRGSISFNHGKPHDLGASVTPIGGGRVLVQTARELHSGRDPRQPSRVEFRTFMADASSGSGVLLGRGFPQILAVADQKLFGLELLPFPRVFVLGFSIID